MVETEKMQEENSGNERSKVLICTVGSSTAPLIKTIDYHKPEYLVYIASKDTREKISEITNNISWKGVKDSERIIVRDPENTATTLKDIRDGLKQFLELKNISPDVRLDADITGGTKPMSAALAMVTSELGKCNILYVGGEQRNPAERMIVVDGKEKFIHVDNPWEAMGFVQSRRLAEAFNNCQFQGAEKEALYLKERRTSYETFYDSLSHVIKAFIFWDRFDYRRAKNEMEQNLGKLGHYDNDNFPKFRPFYKKISGMRDIISSLDNDVRLLTDKKTRLALPEGAGKNYLVDLLANARRRARFGRYDDAVARLYSAVEKAAKIALARLGKDNSNLSLQDLREAGGDFEEKYAGEITRERGARLPLGESFRYLQAIDPQNPVARAYFRNSKELECALEARNQSLLAHGYTAINEEHYQNLFKCALGILGIEEREIWDFPTLEVKEILV